MAPATTASDERGGPALLSEDELRSLVERLASLDRESGSQGEREAAGLIVSELQGLGCSPRVERERVHGTYWWPIGLPSAAGVLAGLRGGRLGAAVGVAVAALVADDVSIGGRPLRRVLPGRETQNVTVELGDPAAARTLLVTAHYDAAHSGFVFDPSLPRYVLGRLPPAVLDRVNTTPPTMWGAVGGPLAMAAGSVLRNSRLRVFGLLWCLGYAAAMADIGARPVVPAANDNATGVAALLSLARSLAADPPEGVRVILLFTGSEESILEGMVAWARRHLAALSPETTDVICVDTVGSPYLLLLEGEGMLRMREYEKSFLAFLRGCAGDEGIELRGNLRLRNATDGFVTMKAGYRTAMLGSVDQLKMPTNYHWPTDTADRVDYGTVADAARLCRRAVDRLADAPAGA